MELVQEIYNGLKHLDEEWPEQAVIAVRDADGEIKFSSVGKYDVVQTFSGIYMRGDYCLFNKGMAEGPSAHFYGTKDRPAIVTRSEYEEFFYSKS